MSNQKAINERTDDTMAKKKTKRQTMITEND